MIVESGDSMLGDFESTQPIAYRILVNSVNKEKISHAYLIESNDYPKKLDFAIALSKFLLCPQKKILNQHCPNCNICHRIDTNNFTELKIIEPDGLWIKKEQLEELQNEFSKKSIESDKKIYIINNAEKMNQAAANSILKFLEEPEPNIIAILITDNIYQLLNTIRSRCQIITLKNTEDKMDYEKDENKKLIYDISITRSNSLEEIEKNILNTDYLELINDAVNFVDNYEKIGQAILLDINKLWHQKFNDKEKILLGLDVIMLYYKDILNYKLNRNIVIFNKYIDDIIKIAEKNTNISLCMKIKIVIECYSKIKYNANTNLLMDKLILSLEEVE